MQASQLRRILGEAGLDVVNERSNANEIVIVCPQCGDKSGNRSVAVKSLLTNCWRCNRAGSLANWAKQAGFPVAISDSVIQAVGLDEVQGLVDSLETVGQQAIPSGYIPEVPLPRGFTAVADEPDCAYARLIGRMAERKRLSLADLTVAGVGFTRQDWKWEPYAIFPVFEWGRPVYYQGRTYTDPKDGAPTKKFPSKVECPLGSRYWVYNIDEVRRHGGVVVIMESILNVLSFKRELAKRGVVGVVPIAVFKHKVSNEQHAKLCKTAAIAKTAGFPVTEWCFIYDEDAYASSFKDIDQFSNWAKTSTVKMPPGVDVNDDATAAMDLFLGRRLANKLSAIIDTMT